MSSQNVIFAAELAFESGTLICHSHNIPDEALSRYWIVSRCRLQHWLSLLSSFDRQLRDDPSNSRLVWSRISPLAEEIINTEILTRVWGSILSGIDRQGGVDDCDCIGRGVLMGHLEAKNRVIRLMLFGQTRAAVEVLLLEKIRRKAERWTDLLIAFVHQHSDAIGFACDEMRVESISEDFRNEMETESGKAATRVLTSAAIKQSFSGSSCHVESTPFNTEILSAILDSINPAIYNGVGRLYSRSDLEPLDSSLETVTGLRMMLDDFENLRKWRSGSHIIGHPR